MHVKGVFLLRCAHNGLSSNSARWECVESFTHGGLAVQDAECAKQPFDVRQPLLRAAYYQPCMDARQLRTNARR